MDAFAKILDDSILIDQFYRVIKKGYTCNISISLVVGGCKSEMRSVTSGVPQGSILGSLLFVIHINDLPHNIKNCGVLMYADDTVLFCAGPNAATIEQKLNQDLVNLGEWLQENSQYYQD